MVKGIKPDLVIEAYRKANGELFITYGGTPPPSMCAVALEVAQDIWAQFGPCEEPTLCGDSDGTSDGTDDWFDGLPLCAQSDYDDGKYDWDGERG